MIYGIFNFYWVPTMANPVGVIHVQYYQLDSIGKNRSSIRPICSIWRIEKFLDDATSSVFYPTIHLISESDPLQVCRFSRFVLFGEWKMLFTTRQVEFRFVWFDEWKILCSIWHIVLSIRKLHLINDNDPCKFVDSADSFNSANGYF